jgi:hypothetical protein
MRKSRSQEKTKKFSGRRVGDGAVATAQKKRAKVRRTFARSVPGEPGDERLNQLGSA